MVDLITAFGALGVVLVGAYFFGMKKKREGLAAVLSQPQSVARIYLRADSEVQSFWLQAEMVSGKKVRLAAPWDVAATLLRVEAVGLKLSTSDQAAFDACFTEMSARPEPTRPERVQGHNRVGLTATADV